MKSFPKGVHPPERKYTADCAIQTLAVPETLRIPLSQHIGAPCAPLVQKGDSVKKGQLIAVAEKGLHAKIFSSVSGTVMGTEDILSPTGVKITHLVIQNDFLDTEEERLSPLGDDCTPMDVISRIYDCGIVGMGGASFPTHVKVNPPKDKVVDTLLINAAECEPYITCDDRVMQEYTEELCEGVKYLAKALNVQSVFIGVEENKPLSVQALQKNGSVGVTVLKTKYPQGAEKQLIYAATGRRVPACGLPADIGVVVCNVQTAFAVYRACKLGIPCYERVMTVSGGAVNNPGNYWVRTGLSYEQVLEAVGGLKEDAEMVKMLSGGPMMGFSQHNLKQCVGKATSSLLFLTAEEVNTDQASVCINCGKCASVCPMRLMPMYIDGYALARDFEGSKKYGAMNCIECGSCAYICPAKRPLVQSIRLAKKIIRARNI